MLIGVGTNERGKTAKLGAVISACDKPQGLIKQTLHDLGQADATRITTFTDGNALIKD